MGGHASGCDWLGTASPVACWTDSMRRQKNGGDKVRWSCILVVSFGIGIDVCNWVGESSDR